MAAYPKRKGEERLQREEEEEENKRHKREMEEKEKEKEEKQEEEEEKEKQEEEGEEENKRHKREMEEKEKEEEEEKQEEEEEEEENKRHKREMELPRVSAKDVQPGKHLELIPLQQPSQDFCTFVENSSKADVVGFFRETSEELERRRIQDFHMKVKDRRNSFYIQVFYGDQREGPEEVAPGACISCFADALLFPGLQPQVTAGDCVLKEYSDQPYVQCSVDAKARPGFIITPIRHVEKMSELEDEELFALWNVAVRALRKEAVPFMSMLLNHGAYRNLPHLHLKVWVDDELHRRARLSWTQERLDLWKRLMELTKIQPKKKLCVFFQKYKRCRYGHNCRFIHAK